MRYLMFSMLLVLLALSGCASTEHSMNNMSDDGGMGHAVDNTRRVTVAANDLHEDCFSLKVGQGITYSFTSDGPLRYNLHWHAAEGMKNAVEEVGVDSARGSFTASQEEYYCLMWKNDGHLPVSLNYSYIVGK